jgi:hypothetical protein
MIRLTLRFKTCNNVAAALSSLNNPTNSYGYGNNQHDVRQDQGKIFPDNTTQVWNKQD